MEEKKTSKLHCYKQTGVQELQQLGFSLQNICSWISICGLNTNPCKPWTFPSAWVSSLLRATLIEASSACRGWKKQTKQTYLVCIRRSFLSIRPVFPPSGGDNGVKIRSVCSIINTMAQDDCTQTDPQLSSLQRAATHKQTQSAENTGVTFRKEGSST